MLNHFLVRVAFDRLLSIFVADNDLTCCLLNRPCAVSMAGNGDLSKIFWKLESAESEWKSFLENLEHTVKCERHRFRAEMCCTPSLTKYDLGNMICQMAKFMSSQVDHINQLLGIFGPVKEENQKLITENMGLQDSLLSHQNSVIELQRELIMCRDEQLQSVEKTVKTEIESYSEAVKSAQGSQTPSVKAVQRAVQKVVQADDRSKNIIVFGLKEEDDEAIDSVIDEVLESVGQKPRHESVRIGKKQAETEPSKPRPVKVSLASHAHVTEILRSARLLKNVERFKNVFISPDRTSEERKCRREAVTLLRKKLSEEPGKKHFIRNNKVVSE